MKLLLSFIACTLILASSCSGELVVRVSPSDGSDTQDCGPVETPCATLPWAMTLVRTAGLTSDEASMIQMASGQVHLVEEDVVLTQDGQLGDITLTSVAGEGATINLNGFSIRSNQDDTVPLVQSLTMSHLTVVSGSPCLNNVGKIPHISLEHVEFENCTADSGGGAIASFTSPSINGSLELQHCRFTNCHGGSNSGRGGAVLASFSAVNMIDVDFSRCSSYMGGAVFFNSPTSIHMLRVNVENCEALVVGGAIVVDHGQHSPVVVESSSFKGCSAQTGGAFKVSGSTLTLSDTTVTGNSGLIMGGALYFEGSSEQEVLRLLNGTEIQKNNSPQGSGIFLVANAATSVETDGTALLRANDGGGANLELSAPSVYVKDIVPCGPCSGPNTFCAIKRHWTFSEDKTIGSSGCVTCSEVVGRHRDDAGVCVCLDDHPECGACSEGVYLASTRNCSRDVFVNPRAGDDEANAPCISGDKPCATIRGAEKSGYAGAVNPVIHLSEHIHRVYGLFSVAQTITFSGVSSGVTRVDMESPGADAGWIVNESVANFTFSGVALANARSKDGVAGLSCSSQFTRLDDVIVEDCVSERGSAGVVLAGGKRLQARNLVVRNTHGDTAAGFYGPGLDAADNFWIGGAVYNNTAFWYPGVYLSQLPVYDVEIAYNSGTKGGGLRLQGGSTNLDASVIVHSNTGGDVYGPDDVDCQDAGCLSCWSCKRSERLPLARCAVGASTLGSSHSTKCIPCALEFGQVVDVTSGDCVCDENHPNCDSCASGGLFWAVTGECHKSVYIDQAAGSDENWPCFAPDKPCASLEAGLEIMSVGNTGLELVLGEGTFYRPPQHYQDSWVVRSMRVRGVGSDKSVIDLQQGHLMAIYGDLSLTDLTVRNGSTTTQTTKGQDGGCLWAWQADVNLTRAVVEDCESTRLGGCMGYDESGRFKYELNLVDTHLRRCRAMGGGGLYVTGVEYITISGGSITDNIVSHDGGGISASGGIRLHLTDGVVITNNEAGRRGGGVELEYSSSMAGCKHAIIRGNRVVNADGQDGADVYCTADEEGVCWTCAGCAELGHPEASCALPSGVDVRGPGGCQICDPAIGLVLDPETGCHCAPDHPNCDMCTNGPDGGIYDIKTKSCVDTVFVAGTDDVGSDDGNWPCIHGACASMDMALSGLMSSSAPRSSDEVADGMWNIGVKSRVEWNVGGSGEFVVAHPLRKLRVFGDGAETSTVDLKQSGRIRVSSHGLLVTEGVEVRGGRWVEDGGCLAVEGGGGEFVGIGSSFTGCESGDDGGGMWVGGVARLEEVRLIGNSAGGDGGGIAVNSGGTVSMRGGGLVGNEAIRFGGGMYVYGAGVVRFSGSVCVLENGASGVACDGFGETGVCYIEVEWSDGVVFGGSGNRTLECLMEHGSDVDGKQRVCEGLLGIVPFCLGEHKRNGGDCSPKIGWDEGAGVCQYSSGPGSPEGKRQLWMIGVAFVCVSGVVGLFRYRKEGGGGSGGSGGRRRRRQGGSLVGEGGEGGGGGDELEVYSPPSVRGGGGGEGSSQGQ